MASYGGKDRSPMGYRAAGRLERALAANGVDHDIKVYPEASHGFLNNHPPADQTPLLMVLNKVSGTRYHEPSALDARRRIVAFFDRHVSPVGVRTAHPDRVQGGCQEERGLLAPGRAWMEA